METFHHVCHVQGKGQVVSKNANDGKLCTHLQISQPLKITHFQHTEGSPPTTVSIMYFVGCVINASDLSTNPDVKTRIIYKPVNINFKQNHMTNKRMLQQPC